MSNLLLLSAAICIGTVAANPVLPRVAAVDAADVAAADSADFDFNRERRVSAALCTVTGVRGGLAIAMGAPLAPGWSGRRVGQPALCAGGGGRCRCRRGLVSGSHTRTHPHALLTRVGMPIRIAAGLIGPGTWRLVGSSVYVK